MLVWPIIFRCAIFSLIRPCPVRTQPDEKVPYLNVTVFTYVRGDIFCIDKHSRAKFIVDLDGGDVFQRWSTATAIATEDRGRRLKLIRRLAVKNESLWKIHSSWLPGRFACFCPELANRKDEPSLLTKWVGLARSITGVSNSKLDSRAPWDSN